MPATTATVAEIQQGLADGQFSSVEITQDYLTKIGLFNDSINCFITITDVFTVPMALKHPAHRKSWIILLHPTTQP